MIRWRVLSGVATIALLVGVAPALGLVRAPGRGAAARSSRPAVLEIYYSPPILVRAGERVLLSVQVACATGQGRPCGSRVAIKTAEAGGPYTSASGVASPRLAFDVSAAASRAVAGGSSGSVSFSLTATGPGGAQRVLPASGDASPLRFYATSDMPVARLPSIPFGRVRRGRTVLSLPWGTGPDRAGLRLGRESATAGPPSFDVDGQGRVLLADALQGRLAVFQGGRLVRESDVAAGPDTGIAAGGNGSTFLSERAAQKATVRRVDDRGRVGGPIELGTGFIGETHPDGNGAAMELLPEAAWLAVSSRGRVTGPTTGRPMPDGSELLRLGTTDFLRLGTVRAGRLVDAVEVRGDGNFGDVVLAEPDGLGGYYAVERVWRSGPRRGDQYQFMHVKGGRVLTTFAMRSDRFAQAPPGSRFRLGGDGALYQMVTSPAGLRIVRYDLGGKR